MLLDKQKLAAPFKLKPKYEISSHVDNAITRQLPGMLITSCSNHACGVSVDTNEPNKQTPQPTDQSKCWQFCFLFSSAFLLWFSNKTFLDSGLGWCVCLLLLVPWPSYALDKHGTVDYYFFSTGSKLVPNTLLSGFIVLRNTYARDSSRMVDELIPTNTSWFWSIE